MQNRSIILWQAVGFKQSTCYCRYMMLPGAKDVYACLMFPQMIRCARTLNGVREYCKKAVERHFLSKKTTDEVWKVRAITHAECLQIQSSIVRHAMYL